MKTISSWQELEPFGVIPLTGEACSLMLRILFDFTEQGRKIVGKCLGVSEFKGAEPWNRGTKKDPHVGSVLLTAEMLVPLSIFALLESGCREVYLIGRNVIGIEASDPADAVTTMLRVYKVEHARRFSYSGTAGDRNVHQMSQRIE